MSLETRIPKEIHDYREKIVFGLSARQLAALGAAVPAASSAEAREDIPGLPKLAGVL